MLVKIIAIFPTSKRKYERIIDFHILPQMFKINDSLGSGVLCYDLDRSRATLNLEFDYRSESISEDHMLETGWRKI